MAIVLCLIVCANVWEGAMIICRTLLVKMTAIIVRLYMLFNIASHCFYDLPFQCALFLLFCYYSLLRSSLSVCVLYISRIHTHSHTIHISKLRTFPFRYLNTMSIALKDIARNWAVDLIFVFWLFVPQYIFFSNVLHAQLYIQWFVNMAKAVLWCCQLTIH